MLLKYLFFNINYFFIFLFLLFLTNLFLIIVELFFKNTRKYSFYCNSIFNFFFFMSYFLFFLSIKSYLFFFFLILAFSFFFLFFFLFLKKIEVIEVGLTLYNQFLSLAKFLEFVDYFFFDKLSKNYEQYRIIPDNHYAHIILNLWHFTFTTSIVLVGLSLYINFFLFLYTFNSKKIKNIKITKNFLFKIIFIILFGFPFFLLIKIKDLIFFLQKNSCNNSLYHGFFNYILVELTCYLDELKRLLYTMKIVYRKNKEINFYILNKLI